MADLILPHFAAGSGHEIIIDGVTYKVPRIDAAGRVYVNAKATGASEVKAVRVNTTSPSTTRVTIITPTSGKRVRVVSVLAVNRATPAGLCGIFFGTGAGIGITPANAVHEAWLNGDHTPNSVIVWPDGGGPIGDVDEVLSYSTAVDIGGNGSVLVQYREE